MKKLYIAEINFCAVTGNKQVLTALRIVKAKSIKKAKKKVKSHWRMFYESQDSLLATKLVEVAVYQMIK